MLVGPLIWAQGITMFRMLTVSLIGASALASVSMFAQTNPLFTASTLPFQAPPFDRIKDSDFRPALEEGMKQQLAEVQAIADNPAPPTFENTCVALEKSGQMLTRVNLIFNGLTGANTNDELQKVQQDEAPKLAATQDAIYLNAKLFKRIETLYNERDRLGLDAESKRLVEYDFQQFVLAGAKLSEPDKAKLKQLNEEDATLVAKFVNQLLEATKAGALVVADKSELAGLSASEIEAAALAATSRGLDGKWVLPLQNTTQQPLLQSLTNRATRHALFGSSWTRAERSDANDTRTTIARLAQLRAGEAGLIGFPDYATWKLQDQMAKTPAAVTRFLEKLLPAATARARGEATEIQATIDAQHGGFTLQPQDWSFYAEQVRRAKYDLDESEIKPYFELDRVLQQGVFYAAHELYGLTFTERHDLPVYHKDVRVFEVTDKDGSPLALFYCDYFKRDNKSGGAWMDIFVGQSKLLGTRPVVYNVANFPKPAPGQPVLLGMDDVTTVFHEFGHALHEFFADQRYPGVSGVSVARDFVEFPSQFNEHWALDPKVFAHYAMHYKTGEPMPDALVTKIRTARDFNAGYAMTELLGAAELDMRWHTLAASAPLQDVDVLEKAALADTHVDLPQVPPRYRSSYFMHIWGNGYAAGYYAYLWTQMLADDTFAWFDGHGGLTRANGDRFRATILSRGNTIEYGKMYRDFTGRDPDIEPMLKYRGLTKR
jgi:peptidyl-dipeptidase Dcp